MKKTFYLNEDICTPCALPKISKYASKHAEHVALDRYCKKNPSNKSITILVWRNTENGLGNARPCGLCVKKTIPRYAERLGLSTKNIRIYYSTPTGMHMTTLYQLYSEKNQYISVGSMLRNH